MSVLYGVGAPLIGFGVWGAVDFHQTGRLAEPLRLIEELVISGLAALALYAAGEQTLGITLAALTVAYYGLVYITGSRLLKPSAAQQRINDVADRGEILERVR